MLGMVVAGACCALGQPLAPPGEGKRYDGDKVATVIVENEKMRRAVIGLSQGLWSCEEPGLGPIQVHVTPEGLEAINDLGLAHIVEIDNIQALIDAENARLARAAGERPAEPGAPRGEFPGPYFDDYRTNEQVSAFMDELVARYPDRVAREPIGETFEGREIYVMRVTAPEGGGGGPKPVIFMNACQHAREWITVTTGAYILDQLVRDPDSDPRIDAVMRDFEIILVPIVNPDGYAYTWEHNRLWRKNRRPAPKGSACMGIDTNRNWSSFWGLEPGSSGDPCEETYRGAEAFSELETQAVRDFVTGLPLIAYIDIHSYGRQILSAYGHQAAPPEPVAPVLDHFNNRLMAAISAVNGPRWRGGPSFGNLYATSGGAKDWFFDDRSVMASWTWELREENSFVLDPSHILPAAREVFAGVLELSDLLRQNALQVRFVGPGQAVRVSPTLPTPLRFVVTSAVSEPDPSTIRLWHRVGRTGPFMQAALTPVDGGALAAELPAAPCGAVVQYYVEAATSTGAPFLYPSEGASAPFEAGVSDPEVYAAWDMETAAGWAGDWTLAEPHGSAAQADNAQQGVSCWVTGNPNGPGANLSSHDVDTAQPRRLVSPVINLQGRTNVTVSYWRWYCANIGNAPNLDRMVVEATPNQLLFWQPVETVGPGGPEARRGWFHHSFRLDSLFTPSASTRLRFTANDEPPDTFVEGAVDNVAIYTERCPGACVGDWTRDGTVNSTDVSEFINTWFEDQANGTLNADFDGNGVSNSTDVSDFINAWFAPCS